MNSPRHGGDIWGAARRRGLSVTRIVDFSASINPLGLSPKARRRLKRDIDLITYYPDRCQEEIRRLVASRDGVHPDCILFGNGATQLIHLIPRALGCRKALIIEPSFSEYRAALESCGAKVVEFRTESEKSFQLDLKALLSAAQIERPDVIFLGNPNNPTGTLIPRRTLSCVMNFCTNHRINLAVDESFIEFTGEHSLAPVAARQPQLVVVRSFTKCFALAGLRIGYLVGHRSIVNKIALITEPWSVNTLALAAAAESMKDPAYLCKSLALIRKERHYLSQGLTKLGWLQPFPSETNYLLVHIQAEGINGIALRRKLDAENILIRDASGFRGLSPQYIRIAIRGRKQNQLLLARLNDIGRRFKLNCEPKP
jgi:threonine-phosphate decarboxylase